MAQKTDSKDGGGARPTLAEALILSAAAIVSAETVINECNELLLTAPAAVKKAGEDALKAIRKARKDALEAVHDQNRQRKGKGFGAVNTSNPPQSRKQVN